MNIQSAISRILPLLSTLALGAAWGYDYTDNRPSSQNPPGGLLVSEAPQFVSIGFDDNGYSGLAGSGGDGGFAWSTDFFRGLRNPAGSGKASTFDGTPARVSYYFTTAYIDRTMSESPVYLKRAWRQAYVDGHEVGNHTVEHADGTNFDLARWNSEMSTCRTWLTKPFDPNEATFSPDPTKGPGFKAEDLFGFRSPFLNYNAATFQAIRANGITYDNSIEEGWQPAHTGSNYTWPYTLNSGSPGNEYLASIGLKGAIGTHAGVWEMGTHPVIVPPDSKLAQYGLTSSLRAKVKSNIPGFDLSSGKLTALDYALWVQAKMTKAEFLATLKYTLDLRLAGNRAPFTFGAHTDEYSPKYTFAPNATPRQRQEGIEEFIRYALSKAEVRVVPFHHIINWMRSPVALGGPGIVRHPITATVKPQVISGGSSACTGIPAWDASTGYSGIDKDGNGQPDGPTLVHKNVKYSMKAWWTQNNAPDVHVNLWTNEGACGTGSTTEYWGSISPAGTIQVDAGATQAFTFTPDATYVVDYYTVDGQTYSAAAGHTFTNVQAAHSIEVNFKKDLGQPVTYTLAASATTGGTITPSGNVIVNQASNRSFSIAPASGYQISDVVVDGASVGAPSSYTFTNVTANHTIQARFSAVQVPRYTLAASAGANGTIAPVGNVVVDQGASRTFTITANSGYLISSVVVDGAPVGAPSSYAFTNVTANHAIAASFQPNGGGTCTAVTDGQAFPITNAFQKFCPVACGSGTHHPAFAGAGGTFQLKAKACGGSEQSLGGWWANLAGAIGCREIEIQNNGGHPAVSISFQCW